MEGLVSMTKKRSLTPVFLLFFAAAVMFAVQLPPAGSTDMVPGGVHGLWKSSRSAPPPIGAQELEVRTGLRVLVFSPHPDDETIAAGGLIQRVLEDEGKVWVVFVTNGDGYVDGVRLSARRSKVSTADFLSYGRTRHDEAVRAIALLGLQSEGGLFLGFPDQGIDDLWQYYWSRLKPYTSPYTRLSHPGCKACFSPGARYAGADLDGEIERIIRDIGPDWVVLPDPRDVHPDHAATGVFVLDALRRLNRTAEVSLADTQVLTYLVHYGDYPESTQWREHISRSGILGSPLASKVLSNTEWLRFTLSPEEVVTKQRALTAYQSQLLVLGNFLRQFIRPSELFGRLDPAQIMDVPREYVQPARKRRSA